MKSKFPRIMESKISDVFDYDPIKPYKANDIIKYILGRDFGGSEKAQVKYLEILKKLPKLPNSKTLIGIEVEIENAPPEMVHSGWREEKDGSLRGNGKEYISSVLLPENINHQLANLYLKLFGLGFDKPKFSWRTSIHIHVNVRELTVEQFLKLLLLYLAFERILFQFSGPEREDSVFCVPILRSSLTSDISNFFCEEASINYLYQKWQKYSALNLIRLADYGTVEFRHLAGTEDIVKVSNWIGIILSLYNSAVKLSLDEITKEISTLNTTSMYSLFRDKVFEHPFNLLLPIPRFDLISEGISFCKECLSGINKYEINPNSSMKKFIDKQLEQKEKLAEKVKGETPVKKSLGNLLQEKLIPEEYALEGLKIRYDQNLLKQKVQLNPPQELNARLQENAQMMNNPYLPGVPVYFDFPIGDNPPEKQFKRVVKVRREDLVPRPNETFDDPLKDFEEDRVDDPDEPQF